MVQEPPISSAPHDDAKKNPYEGRWRWWYSAIADWMIRNPGVALKECAAELGKAENTIRYIVSSDTFREYFARRRMEWAEQHDFAVRAKMTQVAEASMDAILEKFKKQGDKIPMDSITPLLSSTLVSLGFGPKSSPTVLVQNDNRSVQLPPAVTTAALEEARNALRLAESRKVVAPSLMSPDEVGRLGEAIEGEFSDDAPAGGDGEGTSSGVPNEEGGPQ